MNTDEHGCECASALASGAQTGMSVSLSQALLACCSDDECRWTLCKPGSVVVDGEVHSVATDGKIIVIAAGDFLEPLPLPGSDGDRVQELERREKFTQTVEKMTTEGVRAFRVAFGRVDWLAIPAAPVDSLARAVKVCKVCNGSKRVKVCKRCIGVGEMQCGCCGHWGRCNECDGEGTWPLTAENEDGVECLHCEGDGEFVLAVPLCLWGDVWVDWRRMDNLLRLFGSVRVFAGPSDEIGMYGDNYGNTPLLFQAGVTFGLIMPYRYRKGENADVDAVAMKLEEVSGFQVSSSKRETRNEKPETPCTGGAR